MNSPEYDGNTLYHVYTIDEDPFVAHVVHDGRGTPPPIVPAQIPPHIPEFAPSAQTRSVAAEFGGRCQSKLRYHWRAVAV
jgi:hypothetical protein